MDTGILEKWLKSGLPRKSELVCHEAGTPQGGIVSPTLANLALDGLEVVLAKAFPRSQEKGTMGSIPKCIWCATPMISSSPAAAMNC